MKTKISICDSLIRTFLCLFISLILFPFRSYAQVTAGFSANIISGCSPLIVVFSDQSAGSPITWNWTLGNGNNSAVQNPTATYVNPGTYTVTLTVSDGNSNDTETKTAYITVFANPTPIFTSDINSGCLPFTVNFSDSSIQGSGAINSWFWDFGDGSTGTQQNPSHTYTSPGNYNVSLSVTDVNGCTKTITNNNFINAFNGPTISFSALQTSACTIPFNVNFNNTSTGGGALTYQWNFPGGSPFSSNAQNPSISYNSGGSYNVSLIVTDGGGCKDTLVQNNFINVIQANFTSVPNTGCVPLPVNFTNTSSGNPSTFQWDFGDGDSASTASPSHTYTTAGTYTVTFTVGNGTCTDSEIQANIVSVGEMPPIDFTADDTVPCQVPSTISFTDNTAGAVSWQWNFGDSATSTQQNPSHTYTAEGNYTVTLIVTASNGCTDTLEKITYIQLQKPDAAFFADTIKGCVPLPVQFSDSSISGSPIVSWNWNFDDGGSSTLANPSHTFSDTGKYTVQLVITNSKGCVDSVTMQIKVGQKPTAGFSGSPLSGCQPLIVDFTDNSSGFVTDWFWNFGDGGTATLSNPSHTYEDTGTFDVTLVVSNNGCRDTMFKPDYISVFPPKATFNVLPGTIGCKVPFTVNVQDQSQGADTWFWDFGEGTTFTGQNPGPVTYAAGGQYTIKLVVTNIASGCIDSTEQIVRISQPDASFIVAGTGCQPLIVTFTDASSSPFGVRNWEWNFGDGYILDNYAGQVGTATVPNGTHSFLTSGTYENPKHVYTFPGTYTVTLTITDQLVCTDTITLTNIITVNQIPMVNLGVNQQTGCPPFTVQFTDLSTSAAGMAQWSWDFGDGDSSNVQNPTHIYTNGGVYTVKLIATDSNGCISGIVQNNYITVVSPEAGFFSNTSSCIGVAQLFNDTSEAASPIESWFWDFGDGTTDTSQNPIHVYSASGIFNVTLAITDTAGCADTVVKTNYMTVQSVAANFGANPTTKNCPPLTVLFSDSSSAGVVSWLWDFGDGNSPALLQNPSSSHLYNTPGKYDVTLVVTTSLGCKDTLIQPELIQIDGPKAEMIFSPDTGCPGTKVAFDTVNVENAISFTWDFGDGNAGSGGRDTNTYSNVGIYHPFLIMQDPQGCTFAVPSPDSIVIIAIPVDAGPDIVICAGDSGMLNATGGSIFSWIPLSGLSATNISNPKASPTDTTEYFVQITRSDGCTNNDSVMVFVNHNVPSADFSANPVCRNVPTDFNNASAIPADTITSWNWNFNNGEGISTDTNPSFIFVSDGIFDVKLLVTANNGCADSVTKQVTIYTLPTANAGSDTAICIGKNTPLQASGGINYTWFTNATLNDTSIANPLAEPTSATTYSVIVSDMNSCKDTDSVTVSVNQLPIANAGNGLQICLGDSTQLAANGGIIYSWNYNATLSDTAISNPFAKPADTTVYYVAVTDSNGCLNTDSVEITVNPNFPDANFFADSVCLGLTTNFTDWSSIIGDTIVSWNWNFNNGEGFASDTNPDFVFSSSGNFDVTLEINTNTGCSDTVSKSVLVHALPVANAGSDTAICIGKNIPLQASGGIDYAWFVDSTLSDTSVANPLAEPTSTTTYSVIVIDMNACKDTDSVTVSINPLPNADAGIGIQICLGDSTQLNAAGGEQYAWNFNSTLSDTVVANPFAKPADTTAYYVAVTDSNGCVTVDSVTIIVNPNEPDANFSVDVVCEEMATTFTNLSTMAGDTVVKWEWQFGDGNSSALNSADSAALPLPHLYSTYGNYTATIIITTNKNCTDTFSDTVFVNPKPNANFLVNNNCFGQTTFFKDTSQISLGNIVQGTWNFGDNTSATVNSIVFAIPYPHDYSSFGKYDVSLLIESDSGCTDTAEKQVQIFPKPNPAFTYDTACLNTATVFTDLSTIDDTAVSVTSWQWSFGDGITVDGDSLTTYTYNNSGTYTVQLKVATGGGTAYCADSVTHETIVKPLPEPQCSANPVETDVYHPEIRFSTNNATTYLWEFAGLDTSSLQETKYSFPDSGTYTVILTQTNDFNCTDTCQIDVYIKPVIEIRVPNAFTPNSEGGNGGDYSFNPYNNDIFFPVTKYVTEFQMLIYNRWGELIFVSNDIKIGWDGYYKGKLCVEDVYVWKIKATFADGTKINKAGDVTLIR